MTSLFEFIWGKVLIAFLLFLFGCASSKSPWEYESTVTSKHQFDSHRLQLPFDELTLTPGMEFVKTSTVSHLYLITPGKAFSTKKDNLVNTTLTLDEQTLLFESTLFSGGQKLLIPDDVAQELAGALCKGKKCRLEAGFHHLDIPTQGFKPLWQQFATSRHEKRSHLKLICLHRV